MAALALVVAACGGSATPSPSVAPDPSAPVSASASPSAPGSPPASSAASSSSSAGDAVPWDDALLAVLPTDVAGLPLIPEPDAFAASASDASLVRDAAAGVVTLAVDPTGNDYAVAFVHRLRPGIYDDGWFRGWRDSFDEGVCEQAGGVTGNAEAEIGGRTTYIGTCAGGVLTYHAQLTTEAGELVVSVQSLGDKRLGEQVMAGLRP